MSIKLHAKELRERDAHVEVLRAAEGKLEDALKDYNSTLETAREWKEELVERLRSEFDDKSEGAQASEKGEAQSSFIEEWEGFELDEVSLDAEIGEHATNLEDAPSDPD